MGFGCSLGSSIDFPNKVYNHNKKVRPCGRSAGLDFRDCYQQRAALMAAASFSAALNASPSTRVVRALAMPSKFTGGTLLAEDRLVMVEFLRLNLLFVI